MVDVALDIGFQQSWYCQKACATYFLKVQALHRGGFGFARYDLANRGRWNVPYAKGSFSDRDSGLTGGTLGNPGVARPFFTHKVSNRSSQRAPRIGQGVVSSIQLLVWLTVQSNLGQTWSTLVKLVQIWSKPSELWEMYSGPCFEGFLA